MKKILIVLSIATLISCGGQSVSSSSSEVASYTYEKTENEMGYETALDDYKTETRKAELFNGLTFVEEKKAVDFLDEEDSKPQEIEDYVVTVYKYNKQIRTISDFADDVIRLRRLQPNSSVSTTIGHSSFTYEVNAGTYFNYYFKSVITQTELNQDICTEFNDYKDYGHIFNDVISENIMLNTESEELGEVEASYENNTDDIAYISMENRSVYDLYLIKLYKIVYQEEIYSNGVDTYKEYINPKYELIQESLKLKVVDPTLDYKYYAVDRYYDEETKDYEINNIIEEDYKDYIYLGGNWTNSVK